MRVLCIINAAANAQIFPETKNVLPAKNVAYVEFGGVGHFYSINYERRPKLSRVLRAGVTSWSMSPLLSTERERVNALIVGGSWLYDISQPLILTGVARRRDIYVEANTDLIGGEHSVYDTFQRRSVSEGTFLTMVPSLGVRVHPYGSGLVVRGTVGRPLSVRSRASYPRYGPPVTFGFSLGFSFH